MPGYLSLLSVSSIQRTQMPCFHGAGAAVARTVPVATAPPAPVAVDVASVVALVERTGAEKKRSNGTLVTNR